MAIYNASHKARRFIKPVGIFLVCAVLCAGLGLILWQALHRDPRSVPTPLLYKLAPPLPIGSENVRGKWRVVQFWASWCDQCAAEQHEWPVRQQQHPEMVSIGVAYKDPPKTRAAVGVFAQELVDTAGKYGIEWGIAGVPETFLVDPEGLIVAKQVGRLDGESWQRWESIMRERQMRGEGDLASRYRLLLHRFRCVVCQNQSIADSDAPIAQGMREQIHTQLAVGWTDAEVEQFWVDRYGAFVLLDPPAQWGTGVLWIAPLLGLVLGGIWWLQRRSI